jgi:hypothetical protein
MDGGMDKDVFNFVEEFLTVLPITVIATALNILLCLTFPPFLAAPLCAFGSFLGMSVSLGTVGSKITYMFRRLPYQCQCEPEGKFAHFCKQFDYLVCNGLLMRLGFIAHGVALKELEISIEEKDQVNRIIRVMSHKAMLRALSFETPKDKIRYFAAGIFCFNFISFCSLRFAIQIFPVFLICCRFFIRTEPDGYVPY